MAVADITPENRTKLSKLHRCKKSRVFTNHEVNECFPTDKIIRKASSSFLSTLQLRVYVYSRMNNAEIDSAWLYEHKVIQDF